MKKQFVVISLLLVAMLVQGQSLDSIAHLHFSNVPNSNFAVPENILQLNDGHVMFFVHYYGTDNHSEWAAGQEYYKVSRHGAMILDTLFIEDTDLHHFMFTKHPKNGGNIRVGILHDSITRESWLQIIPFDDDLEFDHSGEVKVHLSDTIAYCLRDSYLVNNNGDLALHYLTGEDFSPQMHHFALFTFDGVLKHENAYIESNYFKNLGIFNESPLEYFYYGIESEGGDEILVCHILDSLFQPIDTITFQESLGGNCRYSFGWYESVVSDGDDLLLFARFFKGDLINNDYKTGVCVIKYDKQTLMQKNEVFFESMPQIIHPPFVVSACPCPSGLVKSSDNGYYVTYSTQDPSTALGQVAVVKMDNDLNVEWLRYCLEPEGYGRTAECVSVLDNHGIAISGLNWGHSESFFLILDDEGWAVAEKDVHVHPYTYWPNPALNELHLQFSPDVQPTQVEFYDLQGRLVSRQADGLESVDLQGFAVGQYLMKVTLQDGKSYTDKVMKE